MSSEVVIIGIDFSAAVDAGRKTWIARGVDAGGRVRIEWCGPAAELPGGGVGRAEAASAVRAFIQSAGVCVVGLDFPFGLPRAMVAAQSWREWVCAVGSRWADAAAMREECRRIAGGREWKRRTDVECRTPFSPYNLRMHRQTFHGLRDVVAPLVASGGAAALPMQRGEGDGRPPAATLIEICPASTLKRLGLYRPYKGKGGPLRRARGALLAAVEAGDCGVQPLEGAMRRRVLGDAGGDAFDSVIAAAATGRAWRSRAALAAPGHADALLEAHVFA